MKKAKNYMITAVGIVVFALGLCLVKTLDNPEEFLRALPYVCIGIGSGMFGHGMAGILAEKIAKKNPDMQKQKEIEENDERNMAISNRAKAKGYDIMTYVFGALMLSYALMGVEVAPILLFVFFYLMVHGCEIYYRIKYGREM